MGIYFGSLDVSGVNINAHDSNDAAIYINNFTPVITGLKITGGSHNFYNNQGGAIYSIDNIDLIDTSMLFKNNYNVYGTGGAISTSKNLTISGEKTNIHFWDNSSNGPGGAIFCNSLKINNNGGYIDFCGNKTISNGGAIYSKGEPRRESGFTKQSISFIDANIRFCKNKAIEMEDSAGGAIYTGGTLNITGKNTNLHFLDNSSVNGGAIYGKSEIYIITDGSGYIDFCGNNSSDGSGGAVMATSITLRDTSMTFRNNSSDGDGGAIYSTDLIIDGSNTNLQFLDNFGYRGGAIYVSNYLTINTNGNGYIDFCGNYAEGSGQLLGTNIGDAGGAIYTDGLGEIYISNTHIQFRNSNNNVIVSNYIQFRGGTYEFLNNHLHKNYSLIIGNKLEIYDQYNNSRNSTKLYFTNNSTYNSLIHINEFSTTEACGAENVHVPGCYNIYNFYNNHSIENKGIIYFRDRLFLVGGIWDFSNNIAGDRPNTTTIYGEPMSSSSILIRYADISFDTTFETSNCTADVSNSGNAFNFYKIDDRTIIRTGIAANAIYANRHNPSI